MPAERSHLEEENRRLRRAVEELSVLNEVAGAVSSTLSLEQIVETIVDRCVRHMDVEQGAVVLLTEEAGPPFQTLVRKIDSAEGILPYRLGDQLAGWMLKNRAPMLINDTTGDPRVPMRGSDGGDIRSLLSVPMILKGRLIGLLNVFNKKDTDGFTREDQRLLAITATQSAQVIQHARLYQNLEEAHQKLEEYSRSLEEKVAERTQELRAKNEALETANRQIQEATERKSAFLASMSHELRTPMNAIKGFTGLVLRREESLSDRGRGNLQKVTQASDHLLAMINDLLDLSKIEADRMDVNPERFEVNALVATCCDTVSPLLKEGVELEQDLEDGIGAVTTDKARLQQMLINLLSNAIKFTDSGRVTLTASLSSGQLALSVADTGQGIPAKELPTLFDEYRQVKGSESSVQKGTGLGLSITKKFAELLGGSISAESELGKGSTFTVRVPVVYQSKT